MTAERREIVFGRWFYGALIALGLGAAVYWLRGVLTPIFLALTIAYILDPVVDRLERWKLPRPIAIAVVLTGFLGSIALFALLVLPDVVADVVRVARELPGRAQRLLVRVEPWLTQQGVQVPKSADEWLAQLQTNADKLSSIPLAPVGNFLKSVIGSTFSAIGAVLAALIVPILAVYFLNDFDRMVAGVRELIPVRFRPTVVSYAREVDSVLSQFMRGQLTVMAILAVLYGGAYSALGIRLAIPIGIAAGILNIVPYVGSAFALVAGLLMAALGGGGWVKLAAVVAVYIVVQVLEGFVITPRIVGESVGLKEIWVLIALFVGGEIFGFLGVLLAVPAAAVIKIFATRAVERYRQSALFLTPAEEAAVATGPPGQLSAVVVDDPAVAEMPLATEPVPSSELAPVSGDLDEPPGEPARQDAPPEPVLPESEAPTPDDAPPSRAKKQD